MEKRSILLSILLLSLISLTYSLFQVQTASPNPNLQVSREIFSPADNVINVTGHGLATINLKLSSFENPFLNFTDVTGFKDDEDVLLTKFTIGKWKSPYNTEYLHFRSIVNNTENVVHVNYTITLGHDYPINDGAMLVMYVHTNTNGTILSLFGENHDGNEIGVSFALDEAYLKYFLFIKSIPSSFKKVIKMNVTQTCQPNGLFRVHTFFRILNIFDDPPSVDSEDLVEGQDWLQFKDVTFPHIFHWNRLKALNTTFNIRLSIHPNSNSTFNTLSYVWKIPDQFNVTVNQASLIILFDSSLIEAPIDQANIMIEDNDVSTVIDVSSNITEVLSIQSLNPRLVLSIPKYGRNGLFVLSYNYWGKTWSIIGIVSLVVIISDSILLVLFQKRV